MAFVLNDRVKETTTTTGTGAVTLGGTSTGFQTFAAGIGNSNTCYYAIVHQTANEWETGLGTLNGDSSTLTRTAVYESTNSDSAEDFAAGTKDVFCTLPASKTPSQILTTANDLIYANSANTPARLAAGTGNQVLKMNSTGTAIAWAADSAGVSLTGSTDNTVTTVTGADAIQGEANLTFDGSTLAVTGAITSTTTATIGTDLTVTGSDITLGNGANSTVKNEATAHNTAGKTMTITSGTPTAGTTSDIAGGSLTLQGGQGKGTGAGGDIIFQTANASTSASTLNSYATALTISDDLSASFGSGVADLTNGSKLATSQASLDLFYANSATAVARLAKGTGSQVLSMNATATAISWATAAGGAWTKIATITASSDSVINLVDGASSVILDSTYPIYCVMIYGLHPATDNEELLFQGSIDGGSNYNVSLGTTYAQTWKQAVGGTADGGHDYNSSRDNSFQTGYVILCNGVGNGADEQAVGQLWFYNPSSTTFKKHFLWNSVAYQGTDYIVWETVSGVFNSTSAVDAISFKMDSGNIDAGKFVLFGVGG